MADLIRRLEGPNEWGYRDPVEGGFIPDDAPFEAAAELERLSTALAAAEAREKALREEAQFLIDRLSEHEPDHHDAATDFYGHIEPSMERLRSLLTPEQSR